MTNTESSFTAALVADLVSRGYDLVSADVYELSYDSGRVEVEIENRRTALVRLLAEAPDGTPLFEVSLPPARFCADENEFLELFADELSSAYEVLR